MNALTEINIETAMEQTGERSDIRRRLSDKILAAFNHAYSVGEYEIAKQLKAALASNEKTAGAYKEMRHSFDPMGEAELWISFVDARNSYRSACDNFGCDPNAVERSLAAMQEAYRLWSER